MKNSVYPEIFHCIEYTFYIQDFWAICACPYKESVPGNFSLYWIYFLHSGVLSHLHLPWKQSVTWNILLYWKYYSTSGFLSNLRLRWKTECALKFFTVVNILFIFRIFEHICAWPEKQSVPCIFFTVLNILFTFRIFEQHPLALKTECDLKYFAVLKISFTFRIFEQLCACLEK